jgi:phosphate/sulfate permease
MKGMIIGVIAGVIGAAVWAALAYFTGYEIGWLAWGIGAVVGAAMATNENRNTMTGVIAAVITIVAITGGKFLAVEASISHEKGIIIEELESDINIENSEYVISWIADEIVEEKLENGETVDFPAGVEAGFASAKEDYPSHIWVLAEEEWDSMTDDEQNKYREDIRQASYANINEVGNYYRQEGFKASFGFMDAIFFALAIGTAFKIGSGAGPA